MVVDGNGVVVVPMAQSAVILEQALSVLTTESLLQEKIKAGATIGELVNVDEVFKSAFSYQKRAVERSSRNALSATFSAEHASLASTSLPWLPPH